MIVFLNGELLSLEQARVSPLDRGFLFGDGVYEVIPAYAGQLFRIEQHLQRLQNSLDAVRMANPYSSRQWLNILQELMSRQDYDNHLIYLQVTRGADDHRSHAIPADIEPTVFVMSSRLKTEPATAHHPGAHTITREDSRWRHCDIKAVTLLANVLLRQQAVDRQCEETFLVCDGQVTEGAASNIFIVRDRTLFTPPQGPMLLPGVTRDLILEIAEDIDFPCQERTVSTHDLLAADEVWFTSSSREIVPVISVDGEQIGDGTPGAVWRKFIGAFDNYKEGIKGRKQTDGQKRTATSVK